MTPESQARSLATRVCMAVRATMLTLSESETVTPDSAQPYQRAARQLNSAHKHGGSSLGAMGLGLVLANRNVRKLARLFLMALAIMTASHPAFGGPNRQRLPLTFCVAPVHIGDTAAAVLSGEVGMDCKSKQSKLGSGDFWALSSPVGASGEQQIGNQSDDFALRSGSLWQSARTIYVLYEDGYVFEARQDSRETTATLQLGPDFFDLIPDRTAPIDRIAWKIEGSANVRGILFDPVLMSPAKSESRNLALTALYACFFGLILALVFHHFALWRAMRERYQLVYTGLLLVLLFYAVASSGALAWAFPSMDNNTRIKLNYLGLGLFGAGSLHFARTFFEDRVLHDHLQLAINIAVCLVLGATGGLVFMAPLLMRFFDTAFGVSFIILAVVGMALLLFAWRERSRYFGIFIIAWSFVIASMGVRIVDNLVQLPWRFWVDNSTVIAMAFEALVSSAGIAYRIRLLNWERDKARVRERAARTLADSDPLTNLLNRRSFLRQAVGRNAPQQLFLIDIDYFRKINERIGHDGADEILVGVANALLECAPHESLVARLGGDEFAILCHEESELDTDAMLRRIRTIGSPDKVTVTVSVGSCVGSTQTEADWRELYKIADAALYEAKAAGRARSHRFNSREEAGLGHLADGLENGVFRQS